jgi:uncharacterized protein YjbI with pentapeptide repeats
MTSAWVMFLRCLVWSCRLACALVVLGSVVSPHAAAGRRAVAGDAISDAAAHGKRFAADGVVVRGSVDLSGVDTVSGVFECHRCIFEGGVSAHDVTFQRTVDLSGSTLRGGIDLTGATFRSPVLFRAVRTTSGRGAGVRACSDKIVIPPLGEQTRSCFQGRADFSLAVFDDFVSFSGSAFVGDASFDGASFRRSVLFDNAFFTRVGSFQESDFREHTDFSQARFEGGANFSGAQFTVGASFLASQFVQAARFQNVATGGDLNFTFTLFRGTGNVTANFSDLVSGAALVLRDIESPKGFRLVMAEPQVRDLQMDVGLVSAIDRDADKERALKKIEDSSKARDDLHEANDAHYTLQVMKSRHYNGAVRALDYVFYRGVAGYFVRPLRPLLALLGLVLAVALVRTFSRRRKPPLESVSARSRARRFSRRVLLRCHTFGTCLLDTFSLLGLRRGADAELGPRLEAFVYRLLLVCVLIGLANSNPTLRQMVDSLF